MDAGSWSAVCNWVQAARANARSEQAANARVLSLQKIVGSIFFGLSVQHRDPHGRLIRVRDVFSRASSLVWLKMWGDKHKNNAVPALLLLAAPFIALPCEAALVVKSGSEIKLQSEECSLVSDVDVHNMMVEPQSGAQFPLYLLPSPLHATGLHPSQVLAGVGVRCRQLMKVKSINLYAFGMYVHPESLRSQLGHKYAGLSPSELKLRPEFYDDLLRHHEVNLTVRLVVLYKGLTAELIRSAFQVSLRNRLKKIKGTEEDEGLDVFCSYLSGDLKIRKGTVIDIHWQPGGRLHTVVDGHQVGTIFSENLCRAFFDLYIGDPPVSTNAKHNIGESFAKMLNGS